jgi:hypothetical protein
MPSRTPFLTASNNWKSPTTSLAVKGLKINSPPLFSWMPLHHSLKISRPMPPGHEVWMRQVIGADLAVRILNRVGATAAAPATATPFFRKFRRVVFFGAFSVLSFFMITTSSEKVMMDCFAHSGRVLQNSACQIRCEPIHREIPGNNFYRTTRGYVPSCHHNIAVC